MWNNREISFDLRGDDFAVADLSGRSKNEAVFVCRNGKVVLFDLELQTIRQIGELSFNTAGSKIQIHTFGDFVCVTQKSGTKGNVFNLADSNYGKVLKRGDYCAWVCQFPIAFYERDGRTYLIHATDWNRIDITCLESDQILTERVVDCETDKNYFDYFHSSLLMSPDARSFSSNGWYWHPHGEITIYAIDAFLNSFECSHIRVDLQRETRKRYYFEMEWDRPLSWVDSKTLAIGLRHLRFDDGSRPRFGSGILIYDLETKSRKGSFRFQGFGASLEDDVDGLLFYDEPNDYLIAMNRTIGVTICDMQGKILVSDSNIADYSYSQRHSVFYRFSENKLDLRSFITR